GPNLSCVALHFCQINCVFVYVWLNYFPYFSNSGRFFRNSGNNRLNPIAYFLVDCLAAPLGVRVNDLIPNPPTTAAPRNRVNRRLFLRGKRT
ncbi:hypothetical protein M3M33_14205, partial [Loigolactobacillus coryniformis]|uniref:hypothetical protein n=1 Tax=Loigolactobacillus coryniformis TaxID=1610 RepID=UPI00201B11F8